MKNQIKHFNFRLFFISLIFLMLATMITSSSFSLYAQAAGTSGQEVKAPQTVASAASLEKSGELRVKTKIDSVIVFPDRAQVFRRGQTTLSPDVKTLVFEGLPATLNDSSLRISGKGSARLKFLGVEVLKKYLETEQLPEVKKIKEEIRAVEAEISRIKGQEAVLDSQEKFLNSFSVAYSNQTARELAVGRPDLPGLDKFLDYLSTRLQKIQKARQDNARQLTESQARLESLKKKLNEIMPARAREEKSIRVLVDVSQSGRFEVELSYFVSPASWKPAYTMRLLPESAEIELTNVALVWQKTAENWDEVKLTLSTTQPEVLSVPMELKPWYLNDETLRPLPLEERMTVKMARPQMLSQEEITSETEEVAAEVSAELETAETVENWAAVNFDIKNLWTIPGDGVERRVPVAVEKLTTNFDYLAIPKIQETVFLRARAKNTLGYPLRPGKVDLFTGQDFTGNGYLKYVPVGDEFKMFFGSDAQVKVKRELVKKEKSKTSGVFKDKVQKISLAYKITLENLRHRPVEVELVDQIPVSQVKYIVVKDVKITPAPDKQDEKGIITWKVTLEPGKKLEFKLSFSVEYPVGLELPGF
ncbi:MAG: mucoidy inhibitor MuiA family protein [Candidatus Aminicenantes bacterium]|nr:mucoidy inhibitor MuiA family protein [Candidatus Aminicenantes bacterium]